MRKKLVRGVALILLVSLISFFPLDFQGALTILLASEEDDWDHPENYIFIKEDTTWRKEDDLTFNKAVAIIDGATLTIEKGAMVKLGTDGDFWECGYLVVRHGNVIAEGTEAEPIVFTDVDDKRFSIEFYENSQENKSIFRYVEFRNGGDSQGGGGQVGVKNRNIFQKVHAYAGMPAIYFNYGQVRIENSRFVDSKYADFRVDMTLEEEYGRYSQVEIVNSNFEKSENTAAFISEIYCYDNANLCNGRVKLKNNWYGSSSGPNSEDGKAVEWNNGESLILDGFRTKELIADPAILIPGIMGSKEKKGEWVMDPILHTYDDLTVSLEKNGFERGKNFFGFPYDWRKENEITAEKLKATIETIKQETGSSKVDLLAHSMGGLVARSYIEGESYQNDVDQLITLGTPHRGSPESYLKWEAGEGFLTLKEWVAKWHFKNEAEHNGYDNLYDYIRNEIKSVSQLLPDYDYLYDVQSGNIRNYPNGYPRNEFLENLNEEGGADKLASVRFLNVIGNTEDEKTIDKIRIVDSTVDGKWEHGMPKDFYDKSSGQGLEYGKGDETIPLFSAKGIFSSEEIEINSSHSDLPTKSQCLVFAKLGGNESSCSFIDKWNIVSVFELNIFSPIDIQVIDSQGRRVGKDFETGEDLQEIPGSFYSGSDTESEFLTIPNPEDGEYKILTQGTGEGEYRIEAVTVKESENGEAQEAVVNLVGTAEEGKIMEEKPIEVAEGGIVTGEKDEVAPEIEIKSPENKTYINNKILSIDYAVKDNMSEISKIKMEGFLDEKELVSNKIDLSLQKLGTHVFKLTAEDEAQNENQKEVTFEVTTNLQAIKDNVRHYRELGLIKKKQEEKFILVHLKSVEVLSRLITEMEKKKLPEKMKKKLIDQLERVFNLKLEFLVKYLENTKKIKGGIDLNVRDILIDSLKMIKY